MATDVNMPRLSDSMEEGTVLKWLVEVGGEVKRGAPLVEIETDKANMTYEADTDGVLVEVVASEGDTLEVGEVIARIGAEGEEPAEAPAAEEEPAASRRSPSPRARGRGARSARRRRPPATAVSGSRPRPWRAGSPGSWASSWPRWRAVGPRRPDHQGGRRVGRRERRAREGGAGQPGARAGLPRRRAPEPKAKPAEAGVKGEPEIIELSRLQRTVSRRMAESKATAPDFALEVEVDMTLCIELRSRLKETAGDGAVPSFNDMIVKAAALAAREHPKVNGAYRDGKFELYPEVNVGVAVAAQDALVVPVVRGADQKSLGEIARNARALIEKVRDGSITPPELSGGTITVSNLGMYGIDRFTAIINPPQASILSVGALKKKPAVDEKGRVVARDLMTITMACDHRILYGADGAEFLSRVRELLEQPLALAL